MKIWGCLALFILHFYHIQAQNNFIRTNVDALNAVYLNNEKVLKYSQKIIPLQKGGYILRENFINQVAEGYGKTIISRFNACHQLQWSREIWIQITETSSTNTYYQNEDDITVANDGGVLFVQQEQQIDSTIWPFKAIGLCTIIKFGPTGKTEWSKRIKLQKEDRFVSLVCCNGHDNDYLISAKIRRPTGDLITNFCLSATGQLKWQKFYSFNESYLSYLNKIIPTTGSTYTLVFSGHLMRLDTLGNLLWAKWIAFKNTTQDTTVRLMDIEEEKDGSLFCGGEMGVSEDNTLKNYLFVAKYTQQGKPVWQNFYSLPGKLYWLDNITLATDEKIWLSSYTDDPQEHYISKLDANGNAEFNKELGLNIYRSKLGRTVSSIAGTNDSGCMAMLNTTNGTAIIKLDKDASLDCNLADASLTKSFLHREPEDITLKKLQYYIEFSDTVPDIRKLEYAKPRLLCSNTPFPQTDLGRDTILCKDTSYLLQVDNLNKGCKIRWNTGDTTLSIQVNKSGKYWVQSQYGNCSDADTIEIIFMQKEGVDGIRRIWICPFDSTLLAAKDTFVGQYWLTPEKDTIEEPTIWAYTEGIYSLYMTGNPNCNLLATYQIQHYPLPPPMPGRIPCFAITKAIPCKEREV